jgi:hypothetical protein
LSIGHPKAGKGIHIPRNLSPLAGKARTPFACAPDAASPRFELMNVRAGKRHTARIASLCRIARPNELPERGDASQVAPEMLIPSAARGTKPAG